MLMTLVLPGSAQLVAGRRETGRIAMRIWFGLIGTGLFLLLIGLLSDTFVFWFLSNTAVLGVIRFVLMGSEALGIFRRALEEAAPTQRLKTPL